jgi:hypothetical protein
MKISAPGPQLRQIIPNSTRYDDPGSQRECSFPLYRSTHYPVTSFRQIEANRRNALRSTGPTTENGKRRSRQNAIRHGLSAETVVEIVEDIEDYRGFEAAIIADYDARTAVERELVRPSPYGEAVPDPHNQFFAIAIQIGLVGAAILLAMWAVHFSMFVGGGFACAMGQAVVIQNFIGSLFNSHLSTVTQGMLYCLAVGLLGGIVQRARGRSGIAENLASQLKPAK